MRRLAIGSIAIVLLASLQCEPQETKAAPLKSLGQTSVFVELNEAAKTVGLSIKSLKSQLLVMVALLAAPPSHITVQARTTYDDVVAGMRCSQNRNGDLECDYRVGRSLHFAIVAPGKPDGSIYFYSASFEGDYFAVVSISPGHGCVVVRPGKSANQGRQLDLAFVSPRSGKVYRTWQDCAADYYRQNAQ